MSFNLYLLYTLNSMNYSVDGLQTFGYTLKKINLQYQKASKQTNKMLIG